jgi:acetyl-CoA acyltransferase
MSADRAKQFGLTPIARFRSFAAVGTDPVTMLLGPIPATRLALDRAGLDLSDIDSYEVNEAFAPVPMLWQRELAADPQRLNPHGGAIALGHPLGATGAILMTRLIHRLRNGGGTFGLQAICEAGGMANATVVEIIG